MFGHSKHGPILLFQHYLAPITSIFSMKHISLSLFLFFCMFHLSAQSVQTPISQKIEGLLSQSDQITPERKAELEHLAQVIYDQQSEMGFSKLTFVCTHNSRRSQLSQVWFWRALAYFDIAGISSYSGGTEATAFNHRMVHALQRYGFTLLPLTESENPIYVARSGVGQSRELVLFSKKYAARSNPSKDFIAVMVCSQADAACPVVPGAYARIGLPYEDPKVADNTPEENTSYDNKIAEIGREILYLVKHLKGLTE